jgi:4-hydroxybenzoate polyprenyltransferase
MDYFMLLRPSLFLPLWIFFLLGVYHAGEKISLKAGIVFILYTLLMGGIYILNQIIDRESDKKNDKLFLLSEGHVSVKNAYIEMGLIFIISIIGSFFIDFEIFVVFLISFFMGVTYSVPPIETKGKPFLDMIWNGVGYGILAFFAGWLSLAELSRPMFIMSVPYFFAVAAVFVNTTIPDIEGDKEEGKITTGVFLKKKNTLLLGVLLDSIAIIISYFLKNYICLIGSGLAFPIFLFAYIKRTKKTILFSFRVVPAILMIIVFYLMPVVIPLFLSVLIIQKVYYKRKFDINYPAIFSGKDRDF